MDQFQQLFCNMKVLLFRQLNLNKKYFQEHEVSEETRKKLSQAWIDGKYENSPMGNGIHGYFNSIKNNKI